MQAATDIDLATHDLGPLAWVLDELRKSLDAASGALRRFVRDTGLARGTDMASVDAGQLRIARQQLHQAVGALEMVGLPAPAHLLRSMEGAVQAFVDKPEMCTEAAATKVERAGYALTEFLQCVLLGKTVSAVALFPQYKDTQELAGADRVHPADLWSCQWRWSEPQAPAADIASYDTASRARLDQSVLKLVKSGDADSARQLAALSLSLAAGQQARQPRIFWKLCAAFFEALGLGLLTADVYAKRAASRVLLQYASLAKGEQGVSDRLALDLLFFCAQAAAPASGAAPALEAARREWDLGRFEPVDYSVAHYGLVDPLLLSQARKRINIAKETWSLLSGGNGAKLKAAADQFHLVADSLVKLDPASGPLAQALDAVIASVVQSGQPPEVGIAMEVATAILYLEAAFEDLDPTDKQLSERTATLAQRLDRLREGAEPQPLEPWMEELYRRVSDRQTMGSVVGELRGTLGELEKLLDQYFRDLSNKEPMRAAPALLTQMRGVLSVLGLDQAANAVQRMRDSVEEILVTEVDEQQARAAGTFDKLGNGLGALGFLIDMLNYQPGLAKKLFVFDEATGELKPLMGRAVHEHAAPDAGQALPDDVEAVVSGAAHEAPGQLVAQLGAIATRAVLEDQAALANTARQAAAAVEKDPASAPAAMEQLAAVMHHPVAAPVAPVEAAVEEDDLQSIFLEEAREVVQNGLAAIQALAASPSDAGELTTLRRAFHTLKGSSRMVGLGEFGEAAWSLEQVLNTWLADQKPADENMLTLAREAMLGFGQWVDDIAGHMDGGWQSQMFRGAADALRVDGVLRSIERPGAAAPLGEPAAINEATAPTLPAEADFELGLETIADAAPVEEAPQSVPGTQETAAASALDLASLELPDLELSSVRLDEPAPADADVITFEPAAGEFEVEAPQAQPEPEPAETIALVHVEAAPALEDSIATVPQPEEIELDDFSVFEAAIAAGAPAEAAPVEIEQVDAVPTPLAEEAPVHVEPESPVRAISADSEDQVKVIGNLRIGIPLYNVYLNEADEWSRRLGTEIAEWALESSEPIADSTVGWAHALAGSSATVGFDSLSDIARALENALGHTQRLAYATPQHARAFTDAATEISRLLHQFAAGFLKQPNLQVLEALDALKLLEIPPRAEFQESTRASFLDQEFGEESEAVTDEAAQAPQPLPEPPQPQPQLHVVAPVRAPLSVVHAASDDLGAEDDIDVEDAVDVDLFGIFEEEALELLPQLGVALRQWAARPENRSARDEVLRSLHTLKGSARLAGALRLGELAHRMESTIESLGSEGAGAGDIEPLLHRFDGIQANFDALRARAAAPEAPLPTEQPESIAATEAALAAAEPVAQATALPPVAARPITGPVPTAAVPRGSAGQLVRVRAQLLDRLMNQAGEVMMTRSRLEAELRQLRSALTDLTGNLDRLRSQLRDVELQAETQMQSRLAQAKDAGSNFDPLEFDRFTRVQELTRMMAESVNDVATVQRNIQRVVESTEDDLVAQARQTRELQRDLLRTRMVEFEGISDRLYRVVRLASKETGKQVKLDITGGSIEMDRGVLDRMTPAFEHLLRNCVAHGIEDPTVRAAAGKDEAGLITIHLAQEGNDVSVQFKDDGAGLDLARIRDKAVQQGLLAPGQAVSDSEAAQLIFTPGFSTASQVTELSGRGIGMDVVRAEVNALGGRIETATEHGRGTSFRLVLPLTTAVTQVVMIRSGTQSIGVPANVVEIVRRVPAHEVEQAYKSASFEFQGEQLPFFWCGALLQSSARSTEPQGKTVPVVIFRSAAQRIAVHVDEVLGNLEVVVKNLGPQLARLPGLAGMTVLASGAVVLIYNPVALSTLFGDQARAMVADDRAAAAGSSQALVERAAPAEQQVPLVLVVDDSITVRRVTQRLLQREGYRVALAADGLQALERLAEELPAVVLSDIEMPRMDGFDLARNIRSHDRTRGLPIIMITSRIAEKHREHARELGVEHYLGKPYSEDELLQLVKRFAQAAAVLA